LGAADRPAEPANKRVAGSLFVLRPYVALVGRMLAATPKSPTEWGAGVDRYCSSAPRARNSSSQWM
jgi:hypothetical protein